MVLRAMVTQCPPKLVPVAVVTSGDVEKGLLIHEEKVFMQLGKLEDGRDAKI
jgi:predicted solute-binding protein